MPKSDAVAAQQAQFDEDMDGGTRRARTRAHMLRDMMLRLEADDEALKKYIAMI